MSTHNICKKATQLPVFTSVICCVEATSERSELLGFMLQYIKDQIADLVRAHMNAAPGKEATMSILAKKKHSVAFSRQIGVFRTLR